MVIPPPPLLWLPNMALPLQSHTPPPTTQVFFLLKESELTPSGANLLDGRYAVFGYVTQGQDALGLMKVLPRAGQAGKEGGRGGVPCARWPSNPSQLANHP